MHWVKRLQYEYVKGENAAFLTELLNKRAMGDTSLETTISISFAYDINHQPTEAEIFAREALDTIRQNDLTERRDRNFHLANDMAHMALANAWTTQGRFIEAADFMHAYIPDARETNNVTALAAWLYFLGDDQTRAREVLRQVKPAGRRTKRTIPPHIRFMVAYMRHALLGEDSRRDLEKLRVQMQVWNARLYNVRGTPYGTRLDAIMAGIADIIPLGWYYRAAHRRRAGEAAQLQAECEARRAEGDTSYQTALVLAESYAYQGYGAEAEPPAREAFAAIREAGFFDQRDEDARFLVDVAYLAVVNALGMQGRFAEAAAFLEPRAAKAEKTNTMHLLIAWYWFLAGESAQARDHLDRLKPVVATPARTLSFKYLLLAAFLEYKLNGEDTRGYLRTLSPHLAAWDEEIAQLVDNPYRARLRDLVAEIGRLIP